MEIDKQKQQIKKSGISSGVNKLFHIVFLYFMPLISFSASDDATIKNPLKFNDISIAIKNILNDVMKVGGVVAIFAFIYAGFVFVKARGKPEELNKAKTVLINTVIGVAILLGATVLANIIVGTINNLGS